MSANQSPERQWRSQEYAEKWNRLYPVGTMVGVRMKDGLIHKTQTSAQAEVFEDSDHQPVAAVFLNGMDNPVMLADLLPEIPKELEFLLENYPAEKIRQNLEAVRELDLASNFFRLAKHWEYQAESANPQEAEIYRRCAKQLKRRAQWLTEEITFLRRVNKAAPHLLPQ